MPFARLVRLFKGRMLLSMDPMGLQHALKALDVTLISLCGVLWRPPSDQAAILSS
jgi:hypothetical protein